MTSRKQAIPAPTLMLLVLAIIVALYGVDKFLANQEQRELHLEAHNHYLGGQQLLHEGEAGAAAVEFKRAHTLQRSNREYQLALATAQLAAHQLADASDTLSELLAQDSNDGRANLLMARVLAAEGRFKDANSYYHRAIYGAWPADWAGEVPKVRLELADILVRRGNSQELLSEVLLLESAPNQNEATRRKIADLFLKAGSAAHAIEAYRQLIRENPGDVEAYRGLARAEVLAGNYRAAETAVMSALHREPYDPNIQSQLQVVVKLASLDPTTRHLTTAEKCRRSEAIFQLVQGELDACRQIPPSARPQALTVPTTDDGAEALLDQAETLWKERDSICKVPPAADDPLLILMRKLSQ